MRRPGDAMGPNPKRGPVFGSRDRAHDGGYEVTSLARHRLRYSSVVTRLLLLPLAASGNLAGVVSPLRGRGCCSNGGVEGNGKALPREADSFGRIRGRRPLFPCCTSTMQR